ncbi:pentapeptide repeat-containing protein [Streptomyces poonensis]|uniref:pentapeptide repeat-containing protein n=1 Tax=Streptomyces poonensis TaxID=68255 RepID=UPI001E52FBD0|nr:pentapeptide repeat-containing protein [Streptomyces poonensis]
MVVGVLLSSLIAAAGIWYSNNQVRDQLKISSEEVRLTREGQITDRYTKAVEAAGNDAMDVRLGGVYALQRIMEDSPRDHPTIANVLAAYVRTHASDPLGEDEDVPADVQAALTVLVHRDTDHDGSFFLDLRRTNLVGVDPQNGRRTVNLTDADLSGADLSQADLGAGTLRGAGLISTRLTGANLRAADLRDVVMQGGDLSHAHLDDADLRNTELHGVDLADTDLTGADLRGAGLYAVDLHGAKLSDADLGCGLGCTSLPGVNLRDADLAGANLHGANLPSADLRGAHLRDTNLRGADLRGADLRGATDLSAAAVDDALLDSATKLPPRLAEDPSVKARITELEEQTAGAHG